MHQQHPVRWGSAVLDPYKNIKGINLVDMRYAATQAHVSSNVIHSLSSQFFKCENLKPYLFCYMNLSNIVFYHRIPGNKQDWHLEPSSNEPAGDICLHVCKGWLYNSCGKLYYLWNVLVATVSLRTCECHNAMCVFFVCTLSTSNRLICKHMNVQIHSGQK